MPAGEQIRCGDPDDMASGRGGLRAPNEEEVTVRPAVGVAMDAPSVPVQRFRSEPAHKAPSGLEPLFPEKQAGKPRSPEPAPADDSELNPFLARILERVKQNEWERTR